MIELLIQDALAKCADDSPFWPGELVKELERRKRGLGLEWALDSILRLLPSIQADAAAARTLFDEATNHLRQGLPGEAAGERGRAIWVSAHSRAVRRVFMRLFGAIAAFRLNQSQYFAEVFGTIAVACESLPLSEDPIPHVIESFRQLIARDGTSIQ